MDFDLKQITAMLLKRWWIILLAALLIAGLMYSYTVLYVTPMYTASTTLMISTQNGNYAGLKTASELIPTYSTLLRNATVLSETASSLSLDRGDGRSYTAGQIAGMIGITSVSDTGIFTISVTCASSEHAPIIANAIAEIAVPHVVELADGNSVSVVSKAAGAYQSSPNITSNTITGFLIGAVLACGLLVLLELLDTAIKSEDDIKEIAADIPVIGVIPTVHIPTTTGIRQEKRTV